MRTTEKIGLSLAAGAGAAAFTYAGFAATAFLRYGRHKELDTKILLDHYMPEAEVIERHEIHVNAPAGVAFECARNLDLLQSPVIRLIFATRAKLMCAPDEIAEAALPKPLIDQAKAIGWQILEEVPGQEIVIGAAAKPWLADPEFTGVAPTEFAAFVEPGFAKIVWNLSVEALSETKSIVRTETRVVTTDNESRRLFRRYWALASPGIALIRRLGLGIVKAEAEKIVTPVAAMVRADGFEPPTPSV